MTEAAVTHSPAQVHERGPRREPGVNQGGHLTEEGGEVFRADGGENEAARGRGSGFGVRGSGPDFPESRIPNPESRYLHIPIPLFGQAAFDLLRRRRIHRPAQGLPAHIQHFIAKNRH